LRFWDSSALLPLLVREPTSEKLEIKILPYSEEVHEAGLDD
jgi:hypothetical protein